VSTQIAFGDYSPWRFAWMLSDVVALEEPAPCRAALGLWTVLASLSLDVQRRLAGARR
jgi:hypothetical protein